MATSGSINFSVSRNNIIEDALSEIGIFREGGDITSSEYTNAVTFASRKLNSMVKQWARKKLLHTRMQGTVFLNGSDYEYTLGTDYAAYDNELTETTLTEDAAAATLEVASAGTMAVSDNIVIELDDGTIHKTTITGVSGTSITIASVLPSQASDGNNVFAYIRNMERPLMIIGAQARDRTGQDRMLFLLSREEYRNIAVKTQESDVPTCFYYDPQLSTGRLFLWPLPTSSGARIKITFYRTLEDFDSASDTPDFPQEWYDVLVLGLASKLARAYGRDEKLVTSLKNDFLEAFEDAIISDQEEGSTYMLPQSEDY